MRGHAILFLALALLRAGSASGGPVALQHGTAVGKGFAFLAGGQCVILTAGHVVEGAFEPVQVVADGFRGTVDAGQWTRDAAHDLAFATLPATGFASCREPLEEPVWMRPFRPNPKQEFQAVVRQPNDRTEILRFRLEGATSRQIEFSTQPGRRPVEQGDSGSVITMDGRPVAVLTNVEAGSSQVLATSIDLAFALWRNTLLPANIGPARILIRLDEVKIQGQENPTMRPFVEERLQNERGFQLSRNPADQSCRVSLDLVQINLGQRPNPVASQQCSETGLLGKFGYNMCMEQKRNAPRLLHLFQALVTATIVRPDGQIQIVNLQPNGQFQAGLTDQRSQQFEGIRASLADSAGQVLKRGACGRPPPDKPPSARRR